MMAQDPAGYDEQFLGLALPLPTPLHGTGIRALTYLHFTVLLNPTRQFAAVTGVNIDGATLLDLPRTGTWELDPRAPAAEQAGPAVYANNDLDRGHLVRRRDPGWGSAEIARAATEATFFYTNAAPQAADFNQSKELWLGLEDHVLQYADANDVRVSVFTAPVLAPSDPPYRGIHVPLRFWKVAAWRSSDDGTLAAAGFVLDQSRLVDAATDRARAVAPLGGFRTFQAPIAEIGETAGIDFGALVDADVLPETARPSAWNELASASDIRL